MRTPVVIVLLLLSASCHQTIFPPGQGLSEDRFRSVYIALMEESERYKTFPGDTTRHFNADSIFQAFHTSESEFRQRVESYRAEPEKWQAFYDGVVKTLEEKQKQKTSPPGK